MRYDDGGDVSTVPAGTPLEEVVTNYLRAKTIFCVARVELARALPNDGGVPLDAYLTHKGKIYRIEPDFHLTALICLDTKTEED